MSALISGLLSALFAAVLLRAGVVWWLVLPLACAGSLIFSFLLIFIFRLLFIVPKEMWQEERDRAEAAEAKLRALQHGGGGGS